jgi:drug/metabolite transporter (DMT)-like permease
MALGLITALAAAVCYGLAMVLQALGARRHAPSGEGAGLLGTVRAMVNLPYACGLALDGLGFVAQLIALRSLPLYVVQACLAAMLAVTAVTGAAVLKLRLGRPEWLAVGAVCLGLAVLGATAGKEGHHDPGHAFHWGLLVAVGLVAALGAAAWRLREPVRAAVLGALCGLGFGVVGLAVRVLPAIHGLHLGPLVTEPASYALLAAGGVSFVFMTESVRGGAVTTATASMVLAETAPPALLGVLLLGDHTRNGLVPLAIIGFALAVVGALALARYGEIPDDGEEAPQGREAGDGGAARRGRENHSLT